MFKTAKKLILLCVMTVLFCTIAAITTSAATAPVCVKNKTVSVYKINVGEGDCYANEVTSSFLYIKNLASNAKITEIKSSNSNFEIIKYPRINGLEIHANDKKAMDGLKPGSKTTLTFKVKQNQKTYNFKCVITVKLRSASPFTSLKIGTKEYAPKFKQYSELNIAKSTKTRKISVAMASTYKIDKIYVIYKGGKVKTIQNGDSVSLKNATGMEIVYRLKKAPGYYKTPVKWYGKVPSPLHESVYITFK